MKFKQHKSICHLVYNVVNVALGLWAIRKIMYVQDRENVGVVKKLLDPIINIILKVMNVNLR